MAPEKQEKTVSSTNKLTAASFRELLERLALADGAGEEEESVIPKKFEEYKFWKTQPVPKFDDENDVEGPIDPNTNISAVPTEPLRMLKDFEWVTLDVCDEKQLTEIYSLLTENYVEDSSSMLRFDYSAKFLQWALMPPGYVKDWHVGVRVKSSGKLVAFISAIPVQVRVRDRVFERCSEVNFLCVHKKLRSKRLTPVLIKEVTRRCHLKNIWQAIYTAGIVVPSPISTCRYLHRSINWKKLYDIGFSPLPLGSSEEREIERFGLPKKTELPNLRRMEAKDVEQVCDLLTRFLERYELAQLFTHKEVEHWLLCGNPVSKGPVIWTYVVEDPETKKITDFFSFYSLPSSVSGNPKYNHISAAYLFYYATESYPRDGSDSAQEKYIHRLKELLQSALILANNLHFDVFNAVTALDNNLFLKDLLFGEGDGYLNYYMYNYRCPKIPGGITEKRAIDKSRPSGVGFVMI